jgi:hypothetical protein
MENGPKQSQFVHRDSDFAFELSLRLLINRARGRNGRERSRADHDQINYNGMPKTVGRMHSIEIGKAGKEWNASRTVCIPFYSTRVSDRVHRSVSLNLIIIQAS